MDDNTTRCGICFSPYACGKSIMSCVSSNMLHHVCEDCFKKLGDDKKCPICRNTPFLRNHTLERRLQQISTKCNLCGQFFRYSLLKNHEENECSKRSMITKMNRNGSHCKGQWNDKEQLHGIGKITCSNGTVFEGEFKDGKKTGFGKITYSNGTVFEGEFKDGKRNGTGKNRYADGDVFEGEFKDGKENGYGRITCANGNVFEGEFKDGKGNGHGKIIFTDGSVFEGIYKDGKENGFGKITYINGSVFEGEFKDGKKNGCGTLTCADGVIIEQVEYKNGEKIKKN